MSFVCYLILFLIQGLYLVVGLRALFVLFIKIKGTATIQTTTDRFLYFLHIGEYSIHIQNTYTKNHQEHIYNQIENVKEGYILYTHIHTYLCAYIYTYLYAYIYTHLHAHAYTHACTHACTYIKHIVKVIHY